VWLAPKREKKSVVFADEMRQTGEIEVRYKPPRAVTPRPGAVGKTSLPST
jgi:hypothetical protein